MPVDDVITTTANPMRGLCVAIWFRPSLDKGSVYYGWKSMMIIMVYTNSRPSCTWHNREQGRLKTVEASCGCPKYANDVYMNIHNPNPN